MDSNKDGEGNWYMQWKFWISLQNTKLGSHNDLAIPWFIHSINTTWLLSDLPIDLRLSEISLHAFLPGNPLSTYELTLQMKEARMLGREVVLPQLHIQQMDMGMMLSQRPSPLEKKLPQSKTEMPGQIHL